MKLRRFIPSCFTAVIVIGGRPRWWIYLIGAGEPCWCSDALEIAPDKGKRVCALKLFGRKVNRYYVSVPPDRSGTSDRPDMQRQKNEV